MGPSIGRQNCQKMGFIDSGMAEPLTGKYFTLLFQQLKNYINSPDKSIREILEKTTDIEDPIQISTEKIKNSTTSWKKYLKY